MMSGIKKIIRVARGKGLGRSTKLLTTMGKTQLKNKTTMSGKNRYVFISHPIENTGAPLVLLQILKEFSAEVNPKLIHLVAPDILIPSQKQEVQSMGIVLDKAVHAFNNRFVRLQLGLRKDDFVLMNTLAIYDNYKNFIFLWLRNGRLNHAYWFIHEDPAQLPVIKKEFLESKNLQETKGLLEKNKLTILVPSKRTQKEYEKIIGTTKNIITIPLNVTIDKKFIPERPVSSYDRIDFLLSGTVSDGRKGQVLALAAFEKFYSDFYTAKPDAYRDFSLHLVAVGDDYLSQQIKWLSESLLPKHTQIYPSLPQQEAFEITAQCNAVICCSLNETFALYVAEGMASGHFVLRNNSGGMEEQLQEGKNGYFIDHTDIVKFAAVIEKVLNKTTTSNEELQKMGLQSQDIIKSFADNSYFDQISKLG